VVAHTVRTVVSGDTVAGIRVHRGAVYPAKWEPILDRSTHDALVLLFKDPARRFNPGGPTKHHWVGTLFCPCNAKLHVRYTKGQKTYCCQTCGKVHRLAEPVEAYLEGVLFARTQHPEFRASLMSTSLTMRSMPHCVSNVRRSTFSGGSLAQRDSLLLRAGSHWTMTCINSRRQGLTRTFKQSIGVFKRSSLDLRCQLVLTSMI
jgi:hypothetical protein